MSVDIVYRYHDGTKHQFDQFARALGYLDWASQPRPFRAFNGAPIVSLYPSPDAQAPLVEPSSVTYDQLFSRPAVHGGPVSAAAIGDVLRHSLGLSAWKAFRGSRWALRVNPSSGNLHPTEAYLVTGAIWGLADSSSVWHYAPDRHLIEQRCAFAADAWSLLGEVVPTHGFLIALTSIHWRESWKYGERAFRYCQHDLGHAIAALSLAAALHGWQVTMRPEWSHRAIATLIGLDRDEDYFEAEREEPACLLLVTNRSEPDPSVAPSPDFLAAVRNGRWSGTASQLSEDHVEWTFIDEVARATEDVGQGVGARDQGSGIRDQGLDSGTPGSQGSQGSRGSVGSPGSQGSVRSIERGIDARSLMLRRRSAVSLDGMSSIDRQHFIQILSRVIPGPGAPWDALWWSPRIHLALFVHRVDGLAAGMYMLSRDPDAVGRLKAACDPGFRWEPVIEDLPLWLLQTGDFRLRSKRVSCDQDIAADGFFSLGMIADFDRSLSEMGAPFYRHLFWESGVVGQVLYLEAEAAGARSTGIGCFYDDPVHGLLGLQGHAFQSLYHFTVGMPIEDTRLTTEPGYAWEGIRRPT